MAQLILATSIILPTPFGSSQETRAALEGVRQKIAVDMLRVLNVAHSKLPLSAPRLTGRMVKSASVRRLKPLYRGAVSYELRIRSFYASFTNERGRTAGWFDRLEQSLEKALLAIGYRAARRLADIYTELIFQQLVRIDRRSASVSVRR